MSSTLAQPHHPTPTSSSNFNSNSNFSSTGWAVACVVYFAFAISFFSFCFKAFSGVYCTFGSQPPSESCNWLPCGHGVVYSHLQSRYKLRLLKSICRLLELHLVINAINYNLSSINSKKIRYKIEPKSIKFQQPNSTLRASSGRSSNYIFEHIKSHLNILKSGLFLSQRRSHAGVWKC